MHEFKTVSREAEGVETPLEKCVGDSLKQLNIVYKIWTPLRKPFNPPMVPSWFRACLSSLYVSLKLSCSKTSKTSNKLCNVTYCNGSQLCH